MRECFLSFPLPLVVFVALHSTTDIETETSANMSRDATGSLRKSTWNEPRATRMPISHSNLTLPTALQIRQQVQAEWSLG